MNTNITVFARTAMILVLILIVPHGAHAAGGGGMRQLTTKTENKKAEENSPTKTKTQTDSPTNKPTKAPTKSPATGQILDLEQEQQQQLQPENNVRAIPVVHSTRHLKMIRNIHSKSGNYAEEGEDDDNCDKDKSSKSSKSCKSSKSSSEESTNTKKPTKAPTDSPTKNPNTNSPTITITCPPDNELNKDKEYGPFQYSNNIFCVSEVQGRIMIMIMLRVKYIAHKRIYCFSNTIAHLLFLPTPSQHNFK
jgi:hypothetical protein